MVENNQQHKTCILMAFAMPSSNGIQVVRPPCPQTSKSNIITNLSGCPDYDESRKECKWILARDAILEMTDNGIIKPVN